MARYNAKAVEISAKYSHGCDINKTYIFLCHTKHRYLEMSYKDNVTHD